MFRCLIALLTLVTTVASAAPAYTWVDAQGRRHFSDRPAPGATQIDLPDGGSSRTVRPTSITSAAADARQATQSSSAPPTPALGYTRFDVVSPTNEETLWNLGGTLSISLAVEPALQETHALDIVMDGERIPLNSRTAQLTISEVYRGLHTLQGVIVDLTTGREVLRTQPVTVMVQQTSIQNPNNPNN